MRDGCHDKPFAAAVQWVYRMESYTPIWSPRRAALPD
jgi:hypothetical protein